MPDVPVHDLLVHPREQDLVVGTYGRAMYITDVSALQQLDEKVLAEDVHVFDIEPAKAPSRRAAGATTTSTAIATSTTPNEPNALSINYYLRDTRERKVAITVADLSNRLLGLSPEPPPGPQHRAMGHARHRREAAARRASTS